MLRRLGGISASSSRLCGALFLTTGVLHLVRPAPFEAIVPPALPAPRALVLVSGLAEIAGGAGLLAPAPRVRRAAMWWLLATLAAVFPANVHMARHPERFPRVPGGRRTLLARLPLQPLLGWWVVRAARR